MTAFLILSCGSRSLLRASVDVVYSPLSIYVALTFYRNRVHRCPLFIAHSSFLDGNGGTRYMREVVIYVCPLIGKWHQLISHGEIQYAPHRVYWTLPETQSQRANVSYLYYLAKHLNSQQVIQAGTANPKRGPAVPITNPSNIAWQAIRRYVSPRAIVFDDVVDAFLLVRRLSLRAIASSRPSLTG